VQQAGFRAPLKQIRIRSFRCLGEVELALKAGCNYLYGANGAGKTSVLEAMYLLGRGRSFRTRATRRLVKRGTDGFVIVADVEEQSGSHRVGMRFVEGALEKRRDGVTIRGMATFAQALPVHALDPGIHQLIEGGPRVRRQYLDWGVFHVKHSYLESWRRYRRVLGQRNAALKAGVSRESRAVWTTGLIEAGNAVHTLRQEYVTALARELEALGKRLLGEPIEIRYAPGWPEGMTLEAALIASEKRERASGQTEVGSHRADLRIQLAAQGVREEASRGQQKLVAAALVLGQIRVFAAAKGTAGLVLVDDAAAELDSRALEGFLEVVDELPAQKVLTALTERQLSPRSGAAVFHVEQGEVRQMV
jgi:DNA replication and repair protein RecF